MLNQYTLITGATSGVGLESAKQLARKGEKLVVVGRSGDRLKAIAEMIDGDHLYFCCDLQQTHEIAHRLAVFLLESDAVVHKVIHCAGIDQSLPVKALSADSIDTVLRVNFYSIVEIISVLLKRSVNKSSLVNIIFVSSICSIRGFKAKTAYSASKSALDAYMRVLSKELAPRVVVNSILPGAFPSPMSQSTFENAKVVQHLNDIYPLGVGSVARVVAMIVLYHGLEDGWVTGQQIVVDGGVTA